MKINPQQRQILRMHCVNSECNTYMLVAQDWRVSATVKFLQHRKVQSSASTTLSCYDRKSGNDPRDLRKLNSRRDGTTRGAKRSAPSLSTSQSTLFPGEPSG